MHFLSNHARHNSLPNLFRSMEHIQNIKLWGTKVIAGTVSLLNLKDNIKIGKWRQRPLRLGHPYVYMGGIYLKRN